MGRVSLPELLLKCLFLDLNECEVNNGVCGEAQCVNSPGHHFCQCKVDYDYIKGHPTCAG